MQTGLGLVLSEGGSTSALRNSWLGKVLSELADGRDIVLVTVTATKGRRRGMPVRACLLLQMKFGRQLAVVQ